VKKKVFILAALLFSSTLGAQVFRCEAGGQVTYTDAPCNSGAIRSVDIPTNPPAVIRPAPSLRSATPPPPAAAVSTTPVLPPGSCPSETDIRNIHTRLSAKVIPAKNRAALYTELAKAERCPAVGRRYSYEDWKRLQDVLRGDD